MRIAALLAVAAVLIAAWLWRSARGQVRRVPDSERLTRRQRRALADATRTLNKPSRHLRLVEKK